MPQGYYTLEEAAQVLNMPADELRQMAKKDEIRSFQDRGTLRFRVEDVQEMSRIRSGSSDPDLVLGEPSVPRSADSPAPKSPSPQSASPDVFGFDLDEDEGVDFGIDLGEQSSASKKSGVLTPRAGSDSDVKLVGGGSDDFALTVDSDPGAKKDLPGDAQVKRDTEVKLSDERNSELFSTPNVNKGPSGPQLDSGVRLVSIDSDSDVKIVPDSSDEIPLGDMPPRSAADSDVRLEEITSPKPSSEQDMTKTDEIRLDDLDMANWEEDLPKKQSKVKPKNDLPVFSEESPFEISESDTPNVPTESISGKDSSGEFELSVDDSDDEMLLGDSSDDFNLELPDDDDNEFALSLDDSGDDLQGPGSGINLDNPADSGISLEEDGSEPDFELSLDEPTPKPAAAKKEADSDSEFELSLDMEDSGVGFQGDSDSEFELTLDDSGELEGERPQVKAGEQDVFETDFEVPVLDEESGSQVAALETDLDSSDFELALDDSDLSLEEEESGSQVVALDEEDADAGADTLQTTEEPEIDVLDDEFDIEEDDFDDEGAPDFGGIEEEAPDDEEEATVREVVVKEKVSNPPWGALPMIFMLPCVVLMVVIGLMGYELIQSANGYSEPGFLTKHLSDLILKK